MNIWLGSNPVLLAVLGDQACVPGSPIPRPHKPQNKWVFKEYSFVMLSSDHEIWDSVGEVAETKSES